MNDEIDIDADADPREEIARLESRIEELADGVERCRKIAIFAQILLAAGALWLAAEMFGFARSGAPGTIGAITAILGGFILGGSNRSTMLQIQSQLDDAEQRRKDLIGAIELRIVGTDVERGPWLN